MIVTNVLLIVAAYLLGSLSSAIVYCKLAGLPDPRTQGSRNPGATNVLRFGGRTAAAIVLLGDFLKGLVPVLAAHALQAAPPTIAAAGFAAFLGHLYPVFFRFQGGKGVATAFGVFLALAWQVGVAALATWLAMAALFRISSLSALTAAVLTPLYFWWLVPQPAYVVLSTAVSLLLIWRHRSNIRNLLHGTEDRIGTDRR